MFVGKDFTPAVIDEVQKDSPAQIAGMQKNDIIIEIDNTKVESILEVSKLIMMSTSEYIDFKVLRYDQETLLKVKPIIVQAEDKLTKSVTLKEIKNNVFFNEMPLVKQSRLSVMKVDIKYWKKICKMGKMNTY